MPQKGYYLTKNTVSALRDFDRKQAYNLLTQALSDSSTIQPNARYVLISTSAKDITLSSSPCIAPGVNGQILTLFNVGQKAITLQSGLPTIVTLQPKGSIELIYISTTSLWFVTTLLANYIDASAIRTGVLPIERGGTGSGQQNFVDLSNSQTINGSKTFTGSVNANTLSLGDNSNSIATTSFVNNSNRPIVRVFYTASYPNITANINIPWNFKERDRDNAFNLSDLSFTAPYEGLYIFMMNVWFAKTGQIASNFATVLNINNGQATYRVAETSGNGGLLPGTHLLYLSANTNVKFVMSNFGSNCSYTIGENSNSSCLTIARLGVL